MSFFDDKQEILNLELTPHGRFLISRGKFKPVYYAFFDDDVLYDARYADLQETQNDIQTRILDETLSLKPQTSFIGTDKRYRKNILSEAEAAKPKTEIEQNDTEKNYSLSMPLANCSLGSQYQPAWSISLLSGTIKSTENYIDAASNGIGVLQPFEKIPQINLNDLIFNIKKKVNDVSNIQGYNLIYQFSDIDNTYSYFMNDQEIVIHASELNVDDLLENFDIEIFMEETIGEILNYRPLKFTKPKIEIVDNVLLDEPIIYEKNIDETNSEYYFDVTVDQEIELPPNTAPAVSTYAAGGGNKPPFGDKC